MSGSSMPIADRPITAFMGVRISWLILARNSDLAILASTAASVASLSACSRVIRSVTSWLTPTMRTALPFSSKAVWAPALMK
jgi:hypothetical protein